ncbi:Sec-independent protein translocase protein TatB [Celeribacter marinus]|uniref:Sec-independent protein translocase protein TatB n=1 Tax=Celeribacter marinus TaxID=1397108 RepID=UPI003F6CD93E
MLDIGMSELLVIGIVALIVVGPKDLPGMFRTLGRFTARAKSMAREFSSAMESAADEAGIKEASNALKGAANPKKFGLDKLNEAADEFDKWDPMEKIANPATTPKTGELDPERAKMAKVISDATAKSATARRAKEAKDAAAAAALANGKDDAPAATVAPKAAVTSAKPKAATKTAAKAPAKKPAVKKTAPQKARPKAATKTAKTKTGDA